MTGYQGTPTGVEVLVGEEHFEINKVLTASSYAPPPVCSMVHSALHVRAIFNPRLNFKRCGFYQPITQITLISYSTFLANIMTKN